MAASGIIQDGQQTLVSVIDTRKRPRHVVETKTLSKNPLLADQSNSTTPDSRPVKKILGLRLLQLGHCI